MDDRGLDRLDQMFDVGQLSRRRALRGVATGMAGLLGAGAVAWAAPAAQDSTDASVPFLFVQTGAAGSFAVKSGTDGVFVLTLQPASGQTIYFSDHPRREVGTLPTAAFPDAVPFDPADPPNAALAMELEAGETALAILELREPRFAAEAQALAYEVVALAAETWNTPLTEVLAAEALPARFGAATLFIDGQTYHSGNLKPVNGDIVITK